MMADRELLKEALSELLRLKPAGEDPTRYRAQLYASALAEWAVRLDLSPSDLNKLVLIQEAVAARHPQ
jgi:hypothetical protein